MKFSGLSEGSKKGYISVASRFISSGNPYTREGVIKFISAIHGEDTYKSWCLMPLKKLFQSQGKLWPLKPREGPRKKDLPQVALTVEQAKKLTDLAKSSLRDSAIFRLVSVTGIRRSEVVNLDLEDFNPPSIQIRLSKGEGYRSLQADPETLSSIKDYLTSRSALAGQKKGPLFLGRRGQKLTPEGLSIELRKYFQALKLPKGTGLHSLRRGMATWLYQEGMRERELQELLRWKSPVMPAKYVRLTHQEVEDRANALHPLIQKK